MSLKLKIKKEYVGSKVYHATLNKHFTIEEGNEELYEKLGLNVFEAKGKPKLKKDAKNTKRRDKQPRGNGNRTNNDYKS